MGIGLHPCAFGGIVGATRCEANTGYTLERESATMRGTLGAFIQSCLILLVRADQWRLKDSANCELHRKVSDLSSGMNEL